jgi:hypothetical protein
LFGGLIEVGVWLCEVGWQQSPALDPPHSSGTALDVLGSFGQHFQVESTCPRFWAIITIKGLHLNYMSCLFIGWQSKSHESFSMSQHGQSIDFEVIIIIIISITLDYNHQDLLMGYSAKRQAQRPGSKMMWSGAKPITGGFCCYVDRLTIIWRRSSATAGYSKGLGRGVWIAKKERRDRKRKDVDFLLPIKNLSAGWLTGLVALNQAWSSCSSWLIRLIGSAARRLTWDESPTETETLRLELKVRLKVQLKLAGVKTVKLSIYGLNIMCFNMMHCNWPSWKPQISNFPRCCWWRDVGWLVGRPALKGCGS